MIPRFSPGLQERVLRCEYDNNKMIARFYPDLQERVLRCKTIVR